MSPGADEKRFPSVDEYVGWYNLGYDREDGHPVLHSAGWIPPFEPCEIHHLYIAECRWFHELVPASQRLPFDPLDDPPIFLRGDASDRTLDVDADFRYVTLDLVRRIQQEFLGRHPLYRVILIAEVSSASIVIYPEAVRFGNWPLAADPEKALGDIAPRSIAAREQRLRPARAQMAYLQRQLPDAVRAIGDRPFQIVGVLDRSIWEKDKLTIFVLTHGPDDTGIDVDGPEGSSHGFLSAYGGYGVDNHGKIISGRDIPDSVPFSVCTWYPPADYRGPLTVTARATGRRYTYEVKSENIVHVEPEP